jgi:hypothetical protein
MMHEVPHPKEERSLGELFSELMRETSTLVRQELDLFKTEMGQKAAHVGKDVGMIAGGGLVAYAGLLALVAALIGLLDLFMPWWASALIVGLAVTAAGGMLVKKGLDALKREDLVPRETIDTLKEDTSGASTIRTRAAGHG